MLLGCPIGGALSTRCHATSMSTEQISFTAVRIGRRPGKLMGIPFLDVFSFRETIFSSARCFLSFSGTTAMLNQSLPAVYPLGWTEVEPSRRAAHISARQTRTRTTIQPVCLHVGGSSIERLFDTLLHDKHVSDLCPHMACGVVNVLIYTVRNAMLFMQHATTTWDDKKQWLSIGGMGRLQVRLSKRARKKISLRNTSEFSMK